MSGFSAVALDYFGARAIDPELAASCGVREVEGKLVFPYRAPDGASFDRLRSLNGGPVKQPPGQPLALWWLPRGRPETAAAVLVCEGESDAMAVLEPLCDSHFASLEVVAIPGTGFPAHRLTEELAAVGIREAFLALDADDAGRSYAEKAAAALHKAGIRAIGVELAEGADLAETLAGVDDRPGWIDQALADAEAASTAGDVANLAAERERRRNGAQWGGIGEHRAVDGASFALDTPEEVPAVWGEGQMIAWAQGEPAMLVAPEGVGKTSVAQQLALRRIGLGSAELLGMPVARDPRKTLYIAADRPRQAARSLSRMVSEEDRELLAERLTVWKGPLPFDIGLEPERLAVFAAELGAGTVIVDSLKDVARDLSKDETGSRVNLALQHVIAAGIEVLTDHHQRKGQDGKKPQKLDDVYGSTWITAGAGSVLLLWGEPGDSIVDLHHLKQPAEDIGPLKLRHDHARGATSLHESGDLFELVQQSRNGVTVVEAARHLFGMTEPLPNDVEKARRKLERFTSEKRIGRLDGDSPGAPTRYLPLDRRREA